MNQVITPTELAQQLRQSVSWRVVDVREPSEWVLCHLEGAELLPLGTFATQAIEELDKGERIVLYCHHGIRSERAQMFLMANGYTDVWNLVGGIDRWAEELDPAMSRY